MNLVNMQQKVPLYHSDIVDIVNINALLVRIGRFIGFKSFNTYDFYLMYNCNKKSLYVFNLVVTITI